MYGVSNQINLIAYWHIGLATAAAVAPQASSRVLSIWRPRRRSGYLPIRRAKSGSEVTLTLVTGSVWGKVIWNSWWEWTDIRLVTFLVIWFIYAGYLLIYSAGGEAASSSGLRRCTASSGS